MQRSFAFLFGAVLFEVSWAVLLKLSRGFTVFWPNAGMVVAYVLSLVFLNAACREAREGQETVSPPEHG